MASARARAISLCNCLHIQTASAPATAAADHATAAAQARSRHVTFQIHNPYLATPMSIASYRMATSPTDQNNQNVIAFLDRLQASAEELAAATGNQCLPVQADVRNPKLLQEAVAKTVEKFGRIDFVICGTWRR